MLNYTSPEQDTPEGSSCQALDRGLQILVRMVARHHLRVNSPAIEQFEDKEADDGKRNKYLSDA